MSRRSLTLVVAGVLLVALAAVAAILPVPYVEYSPGPTTNTLGRVRGHPLIQITGHRSYPASGHLNLTTVYVTTPEGRLSLGEVFRGWWDSDVAVVPREIVYPAGSSSKQVEQENADEMVTSQQQATAAALRHLHIPVRRAVVVRSVVAGAPADGNLDAGDRIRTVDGQRVSDPESVATKIRTHHPGDRVRLGITRDGSKRNVTITTTAAQEDAKRAVIGIVPDIGFVFPFGVDIGIEKVGGPSAGLMFALGIIDKLTPGNLTGGAFVAGTGTINSQGAVGPIGGIQQKIAAVRKAKATFFFTPADNCAEALGGNRGDVRLVRVDNLDGALSDLTAIRDGELDRLPACSS